MDVDHVSDESALREVQQQVSTYVLLLRKLSGLEKSHDVGKSQKLPPQELQQAAGIAFFESTKVGLIITGVTGKGFLIQKIKGQPGQWSAPVMFTLKSIGVGTSAGFSSSQTLLILDTEKSVNDFLHTQVSLDSEMTLAAGKAARHLHDSELNVTHPSDTFQGAMYSVAHGIMVDVSFQGVKVSVNEKEMRKLYGTGADDKLVLSGKQPQLPALEPLIAQLEVLQQGGSNSGTTVRDFSSGSTQPEVHPQSGNLGTQIKDKFHKTFN